MWHEIAWDFGDGGSESGSLVYHTFDIPGQYQVGILVKDSRGSTATYSSTVNVLADTMVVSISSVPQPGVLVRGGRDTIQFAAGLLGCDYSGGNFEDNRWADFQWETDTGSHFSGPDPRFAFSSSDGGSTHDVILTVTNMALGTSRKDTVSFLVVPPPTLWLILELTLPENMEVSPHGIFVTGGFNNWSPGPNPLTWREEIQKWVAVVERPRNSNVSFRFVNGVDDSGNEVIPSDCSDGGNRRFIQLEETDVWYRCEFGQCPD
jgi:PKD repeat protein